MHKKIEKKSWLKFSGTLLLILAGIFCCLLAVMQIESLHTWYMTWQDELVKLEEQVAALNNKWIIILVVLLLFTLKSIFPPITITAICLISGMVLPWYFAIAVNILGVGWLMTIRYYWGKRFGCGRTVKLLRQNEIVHFLLENKGTGNPYMLFILRLIPSFPVNSVSRLYGSLQFPYRNYILISLAGFLFKIISYSVIGGNVYNPLSASFLLPIILLCTISGALLLGVYYLLRENENNEKLKER